MDCTIFFCDLKEKKTEFIVWFKELIKKAAKIGNYVRGN